MNKFIVSGLLFTTLLVWNCREVKEPEPEEKGDVERVAEEVEEGAERAGEEIKGAYKDVKEELDGETDDS